MALAQRSACLAIPLSQRAGMCIFPRHATAGNQHCTDARLGTGHVGRWSNGGGGDSPRRASCVARRALQLTQPGDLILILAGKGHNGEDARGAREHLTERRVEVLDVTATADDLSKLDALLASRPALLIDGLFGIGLNSSARAGVGRPYRARQCGACAGAGRGRAVWAECRHRRAARGGDQGLGDAYRGRAQDRDAAGSGLAVCGAARSRLGRGPGALPASKRAAVDFAGGFRRVSARPRGGRRTKGATAIWRLWRGAWVITARRCWRRAARNGRNPA